MELKDIIQKVRNITTYDGLEDIPTYVENLLIDNLNVNQLTYEIRQEVSKVLDDEVLNRDDWVWMYAPESPFEDDYANVEDYTDALLDWHYNIDIDYQSYIEGKEQELVEVKSRIVDLLESCLK